MWGCCRLAVTSISLRNRSAPISARQLRGQHLERHLPVVPEVVGQVDGRHAALAQLRARSGTAPEPRPPGGRGCRSPILLCGNAPKMLWSEPVPRVPARPLLVWLPCRPVAALPPIRSPGRDCRSTAPGSRCRVRRLVAGPAPPHPPAGARDPPRFAHSSFEMITSSTVAMARVWPMNCTGCLRSNSVRLNGRDRLMMQSTFQPVCRSIRLNMVSSRSASVAASSGA